MAEKHPVREDYKAFEPITTRWLDNDIYGHVNNVTYYAYFDTAVNSYLIKEGGLDIHRGDSVGFVVSSNCTYLRPLAYPDPVEAGIKVERLGTSSVQYGVGIFLKGENTPRAYGEFVHVFVNRQENTSTPIPENIKAALTRLV